MVALGLGAACGCWATLDLPPVVPQPATAMTAPRIQASSTRIRITHLAEFQRRRSAAPATEAFGPISPANWPMPGRRDQICARRMGNGLVMTYRELEAQALALQRLELLLAGPWCLLPAGRAGAPRSSASGLAQDPRPARRGRAAPAVHGSRSAWPWAVARLRELPPVAARVLSGVAAGRCVVHDRMGVRRGRRHGGAGAGGPGQPGRPDAARHGRRTRAHARRRRADPGHRARLQRCRSPAAARRAVHAVPRLRQRLRRAPPGCGRPFWADDPAFDLRHHVRQRPARRPATSGPCWRWPRP